MQKWPELHSPLQVLKGLRISAAPDCSCAQRLQHCHPLINFTQHQIRHRWQCQLECFFWCHKPEPPVKARDGRDGWRSDGSGMHQRANSGRSTGFSALILFGSLHQQQLSSALLRTSWLDSVRQSGDVCTVFSYSTSRLWLNELALTFLESHWVSDLIPSACLETLRGVCRCSDGQLRKKEGLRHMNTKYFSQCRYYLNFCRGGQLST